MGEIRSALAMISVLSPYFEVMVSEPPPDAQPTAALFDPEVAKPMSTTMCERIGSTELRVGCSTVHIGYAARLWSLALGTAARTGVSVSLGPQELWFRHTPGGIALFLPEPRSGDAPADEVVDKQMVPLIEAWRPLVATGALWGNVAATVQGAAGRIGQTATPHAEQALQHPLLQGRIDGTGRRTSCCLFYRARNGGYCSECSITRPRAAAQ